MVRGNEGGRGREGGEGLKMGKRCETKLVRDWGRCVEAWGCTGNWKRWRAVCGGEGVCVWRTGEGNGGDRVYVAGHGGEEVEY